MTGNAIERRDARNSLAIAGDAWAIAQRIARTEFVPEALRGKPEAVLACIMAGHELEISPMQSLQEIHVIKGRPTLSAKMQRAIILRDGHEVWVEESNSTRAIVKGRRKDTGREGSVEWTIDDAKRAGLVGRDNWKAYPSAMLIARASSQLSRNLFADVLAGFGYSTEEAEDGFELDVLTAGSAPTPTSSGTETTTTRVRAKRAATRGSDTPDRTEPDPEPPPNREQAPLPGESDEQEIEEAVVVDTTARDLDEIDPIGEGIPPLGDEPPGDNGPDFDEGARARSGPQQIAIQFSNREITDRAVRLRICGAIVGREIKSGNDLTVEEISAVLQTLDETAPGDKLPGEEAASAEREPSPEPEPGPASSPSEEPRARRTPPVDPEEWDSDRWRALLADRGVKASELLRRAQELAALEEQREPLETLDAIAGRGLSGQLVEWVEDLALERRAK